MAVLCREERAAAAAAAVGLALARACGARCALVGAAGRAAAPRSAVIAAPAARHATARLRARGHSTAASGRLVWVGDRRAPGAFDAPDAAAAVSAEIGRAATAVGVPAAIALPFPRTPAMDRVLTWHDALVAIHEPDATPEGVARTEASLVALGVPVVCMPPSSRQSAALAEFGLRAPAAALAAILRLAPAAPGSS